MAITPKILIASSNPGKLREFQEILAGRPYELLLPAMIGIHLEVVEDGATYAENAAKRRWPTSAPVGC